jgi:hypothetical protein
MLWRALTGKEKTFGPNATLFALRRLYVRQGRHDDGRPLLEQARAGYEKLYGPSHSYMLAAKSELERRLRQP